MFALAAMVTTAGAFSALGLADHADRVGKMSKRNKVLYFVAIIPAILALCYILVNLEPGPII